MITITIEDVLGHQLPDEYYHTNHPIYIVRDGPRVLYVGKAIRQSSHERLLQHLAAETDSDFYSHANGPSELGRIILDNSPQSLRWQVDLLTLADCRQFSGDNKGRISVGQAERLLIQAYSPLINRIYKSDGPTRSKEPTTAKSRILPEYAMDYLGSTSDNPKTQDTYRYALLRLQQFAEDEELTAPLTPLSPERLDRQVLARFLVWLKKAGLKNNSLRTFIAVVRQYLLWLEDENKLPEGMRVAEIQRHLEQKAGPHLRSIPQEHRQADASTGLLLGYYRELLNNTSLDTPRGRRRKLAYLRNQAILQTLYSTAGRASEVATLTCAQVVRALDDEIDRKQLLPVEINGNGGKKRQIFLVPEAQKAIGVYLKARAEMPTGTPASDGRTDTRDALFVRHDRESFAPISTKTMWQIVNNAAKAVFGCDASGRPLKRVGPHHFRHLRAQHLHDDGMALDTIQSILGHSSVVTTRKIYAELTSPERQNRELERYGRDLQRVAKGE